MSEPHNNPGRLRRIGTGLALAVGSSLFALLVLEAAVRLVAPQQLIQVWEDTFAPADSIGWTFEPGMDRTVNTGEGAVRLVTDADGYRRDPGRESWQAGEVRVLLLGDSFMAAIQVEYEDSFAALMEGGLDHSTDRRVSVRNMGMGGWDPPQYLIQARRVLAEEPVDLVVVAVYLGNDVVLEPMEIRDRFQPVRIHPLRFPRSFEAAEWIEAVARPVDDRLKRSSHLYILVKNRLDVLRMRLGLTAAWFPDVHLRDMADSPRWGYTVDLLEQIRDAAAERGTPTVFILIPSHFQVDRATLEKHVEAFEVDPEQVAIDQPNEILTTLMEERGLMVVDPLPGMRRRFEASGAPQFGSVDSHLNVEGHRALWEIVAPHLSDALTDALVDDGPDLPPDPS
jgi:hypothetical protein